MNDHTTKHHGQTDIDALDEFIAEAVTTWGTSGQYYHHVHMFDVEGVEVTVTYFTQGKDDRPMIDIYTAAGDHHITVWRGTKRERERVSAGYYKNGTSIADEYSDSGLNRRYRVAEFVSKYLNRLIINALANK